MAIYYLGTFPPAYGGVTIKNKNLYDALKEKIEIQKVDFSEIKRKNFREFIKLVSVFFDRKNRFVIGVTGKKTRKRFCRLLYFCNRRAMSNSIFFLMGGTVAYDISIDKEYSKYVRQYKKVYVETVGMKKTLDNVDFTNVDIYPNGRFKPKTKKEIEFNTKELKCVFFSYVTPQKGVDIILSVARLLPYIKFDFYGPIEESYEECFVKQIADLNNVEYRGVFKSTNEEVYLELSKYDILLFPTKYKTEGVPGILVESKMAGITTIVSNESYNSEIILNNQGIVLDNNTAESLCLAIKQFDNDRDMLYKMKINNHDSAELYYIENYIQNIIKEIKEE